MVQINIPSGNRKPTAPPNPIKTDGKTGQDVINARLESNEDLNQANSVKNHTGGNKRKTNKRRTVRKNKKKTIKRKINKRKVVRKNKKKTNKRKTNRLSKRNRKTIKKGRKQRKIKRNYKLRGGSATMKWASHHKNGVTPGSNTMKVPKFPATGIPSDGPNSPQKILGKLSEVMATASANRSLDNNVNSK